MVAMKPMVPQRRPGHSLGVGLPAQSVAERAGGEMEAVGMAMGQGPKRTDGLIITIRIRICRLCGSGLCAYSRFSYRF